MGSESAVYIALALLAFAFFLLISCSLLAKCFLEEEQIRLYNRQIDLKEYFPERPYSAFDSRFLEKSCSICLEDFTLESKCRELYCQHIFHDDCIDFWLLQHRECPLCKKSMTNQAIKQYFNSMVNRVRERPPPPKLEYQTENRPPQGNYVYNIYQEQTDSANNIALESFKQYNGF